jgi:SAM-dependent methyltransferase
MRQGETSGGAVANENQSSYELGHSEAELKRLTVQASLLHPVTKRLLREAGIGNGMRVLDIGCGAGDVAMLAADLVGPDGSVVGIDPSPEALAFAEQRARPYGNIVFKQAAVDAYDGEQAFDLVVARYVLFHQADPIQFLRAAGRLVRPGGVLAIHDAAIPFPFVSQPKVALWDEVGAILKQAAEIVTVNFNRSLRTRAFFQSAGLVEVSGFYEVVTGHGKGSNIFPWLAETARLCIASAQSKTSFVHSLPDFDGLAERLEAEATAVDAEVTGPIQVCVWATVP